MSGRRETERGRRGFTLVELLLVIAIIGLLVALLLPAIQAAREAARVATCRNNARQLATGCATHLELQGFFPSGGWGYLWTGEPDRGFGKMQPGGWAYAVLPFIGQQSLHQLGAGLDDTARRPFTAQRMVTSVATFHCPSRRNAKSLPATTAHPPRNALLPATYAKTDYAMNIGDSQIGGSFLPAGPPTSCLSNYPACVQCSSVTCTAENWYGEDIWMKTFNGLSSHRSEITADEVIDGSSTTLLLAEKNLNPDRYETGNCAADNGDTWQGRDWDTSRWTAAAPRPDRRGVDAIQNFGSAHATSITAAACDGAVRGVSYTIDPTVWRRLGNRRDGDQGIADWPR